jgi:hypothetical protein
MIPWCRHAVLQVLWSYCKFESSCGFSSCNCLALHVRQHRKLSLDKCMKTHNAGYTKLFFFPSEVGSMLSAFYWLYLVDVGWGCRTRNSVAFFLFQSVVLDFAFTQDSANFNCFSGHFIKAYRSIYYG